MKKRIIGALAIILALQQSAYSGEYYCGGPAPEPGETTSTTFIPPENPAMVCVTTKIAQVERHKRGRVIAEDDCTVIVTYAVTTQCFAKADAVKK